MTDDDKRVLAGIYAALNATNTALEATVFKLDRLEHEFRERLMLLEAGQFCEEVEEGINRKDIH